MFVAEGTKVIKELLNSRLELVALYAVDDSAFAKALEKQSSKKLEIISQADLKKITFLKTAQNAVAIFKIPELIKIEKSGITLVLDEVRDPGNLGTIIRLCDWFGISQLVCSVGTVDCYNPKVVQATMGSLTRVSIEYRDIKTYLAEEKRDVYGTFMDGENIYNSSLPNEAVIIMGNEANGISKEVENLVNKRIAIPRFGEFQVTESLNVATAAAITLSEFKRG